MTTFRELLSYTADMVGVWPLVILLLGPIVKLLRRGWNWIKLKRRTGLGRCQHHATYLIIRCELCSSSGEMEVMDRLF